MTTALLMPPAPSAAVARGEPGQADRPRVLVVEDHAAARRMLARILESLGFEVAQACDGVEALRTVASDAPDAILMDLNMPRMDGYEAMRRLKADSRSAGIPILVLTADVTPTAESEARSAGASAFLEKPVEVENVRRFLDDALNRMP